MSNPCRSPEDGPHEIAEADPSDAQNSRMRRPNRSRKHSARRPEQIPAGLCVAKCQVAFLNPWHSTCSSMHRSHSSRHTPGAAADPRRRGDRRFRGVGPPDDRL